MPPVVRGCPFNTNLIFLVYADNDMPLARLGKPQNTQNANRSNSIGTAYRRNATSTAVESIPPDQSR